MLQIAYQGRMEEIEADVLDAKSGQPAVIYHGLNDVGKWEQGITALLGIKFPTAKAEYLDWKAGKLPLPFQLGETQFVQTHRASVWVANAIVQHGLEWNNAKAPIRYKALRLTLEATARFAIEMDGYVRMPEVGCGYAGGTWAQVGPVVEGVAIRFGVRIVVCRVTKPKPPGGGGGGKSIDRDAELHKVLGELDEQNRRAA